MALWCPYAPHPMVVMSGILGFKGRLLIKRREQTVPQDTSSQNFLLMGQKNTDILRVMNWRRWRALHLFNRYMVFMVASDWSQKKASSPQEWLGRSDWLLRSRQAPLGKSYVGDSFSLPSPLIHVLLYTLSGIPKLGLGYRILSSTELTLDPVLFDVLARGMISFEAFQQTCR